MSEWKEYKLGELVDLSQGQVINSKTNHLVVKEGIPLLRITDMINGTKTIFIDSEKVAKKNIAFQDELIYTRTGQVGLVFMNQHGVVHNNSFKVISKDDKVVYRKFLFWYLKSNAVYEYINGVASGSAQPDLTHDSFKSLTIKLPPLPTQQKIAHILGTYDELIEVNNERIKLLEESAQSLYKEWFVRFRFPNYQNKEFIKGVPKGWEVVRFRDFIKLNRGFDLPNEKIIEGEYPVIASTNIKAFHNEYKSSGEGVITGRSGSLGTVQYINGKYWTLNTALYVKDFKGNYPKYVYYFLKEMHLENFDSGAGVPTLNQNHLHGLKFPLPPINLQKQFDEIISPMFTQIETLQQQNTELRQIRDRLLPRLISGKMEV